jgi:hypothetical protein
MHPTGAIQESLPNKDTQFQKGKSGNPNGRPKGVHSLDTMMRRMLEADEKWAKLLWERGNGHADRVTQRG